MCCICVSSAIPLHVCVQFHFFSQGAAISVESQQVTQALSRLFYNPLCFLLYEDPLVSPDEWSDVRFLL